MTNRPLLRIFLLAVVLVAATTGNAEDPAKSPDLLPVVTLKGSITEVPGALALFGPKPTTLSDLCATIDRAAGDERVGALALRLESPEIGLTQVAALTRRIEAFRAAGKPVIVTADGLGVSHCLLAGQADHVVLPPVGVVEVYGLAVQMYFFHDLLEKLGVEAQVVNTGPFKNAMEPFTHTEMSEGSRIQMNALLNDLANVIVTDMAESRGLTKERAAEMLWGGPYTSAAALEEGIITEIGYSEPFLKQFAEKRGLKLDDKYSAADKKAQEPVNLFTLFGSLGGGARKPKKEGPFVAVVHAAGPIMDGRGGSNPLTSGNVIASEDFLEMLDEVVEAGELKALVLRVDSPGGSAIASDRIWQRLEEIQASGVPVVASMGSVAASGGYYISMGADRIFAEPSTITGSIGVIGGRFVLGGTYRMLGVGKQTLGIGPNVGIADETRPWNDREVELINAMLEDVYEQFTAKAAEGRGMAQEDIKAVGGGRVWSGVAALEKGLVDDLGGLDAAVAAARNLAGAPNAPLKTWPREKTLSEVLEELMAVEASAAIGGNAGLLAEVAAVLPAGPVQTFLDGVALMRSDGPPRILAYCPVAFTVK